MKETPSFHRTGPPPPNMPPSQPATSCVAVFFWHPGYLTVAFCVHMYCMGVCEESLRQAPLGLPVLVRSRAGDCLLLPLVAIIASNRPAPFAIYIHCLDFLCSVAPPSPPQCIPRIFCLSGYSLSHRRPIFLRNVVGGHSCLFFSRFPPISGITLPLCNIPF